MLKSHSVIEACSRILIAGTISMAVIGCRKVETRNMGDTRYDLSECKSGDLKDIFQGLEIVPLRFEGEYYPPMVDRLVVADSVILVSDNSNRIYAFDNNGKYIASSNEHYGMGPGEISMVTGWVWNPYSERIEVLTADAMLCYDRNFKFISSSLLPGTNGTTYDQIYDISSSEHYLVPTGVSPDPYGILRYNSIEGTVSDECSFADNVLAPVSMQWQCFFRQPDGELLFSPPAVTYTVYSIGPDGNLNPEISLIPGDEWISKHKRSNYSSDREFAEYLIETVDYIPLRTLVTPAYIFIMAKNGRMLSDFHYFVTDRRSGQTQTFDLYKDGDYLFPMLGYTDGEMVYAVMDKESIEGTPQLLLGNAEAESILASTEPETLILLKYTTK